MVVRKNNPDANCKLEMTNSIKYKPNYLCRKSFNGVRKTHNRNHKVHSDRKRYISEHNHIIKKHKKLVRNKEKVLSTYIEPTI